MKTKINPNALYRASFNGFELRLPGQCVMDCSRGGQNDAVVDFWTPRIRLQIQADNFPNKPTAEKIRCELKGYGAWDDEQLKDDDENFRRLVWIAAGNIADDGKPDYSEPVK